MATAIQVTDSSERVQAAIASKESKTLAQLIEDRQSQFESDQERAGWLTRTKEVIRYSRPDLSEYLDQDSQTKGGSNTSYMYTSQPIMDLERSADGFCGNVFTPHGWFGLAMSDLRLANVDELQQWLQNCQEHMYSVYSGSNFYGTVPSLAMDAMSIGDGMMYIGDDLNEGMPFFEYRASLGLWWMRDKFGRITTIHEKVVLSAHEAYGRWGNAASEAVRADARQSFTKNHTFLHVVYQKTDPILEGLRFGKPRPFIELWLEKGAHENQGHSNKAYEGALDRMGGIIKQEGYFTMPFVDWPYWLKSGETCGRGLLSSAIFTLKRFHAEHKQMMLAGQKSVSGPMWASEQLRGKIDLSPASADGSSGVTYVEDVNRDALKEAQPNIRYPFGIDQLDRTGKEISDFLNRDLFEMMSMTTKEMTIPEIIERVGEKAAILAPRLGSMQKLFLDPCHARVWQIEQLRRRLPPPPDILYELAEQYGVDTSVAVRYKGPLSQAQEQVFMRRRVLGAFEAMSPFIQLDPETVRAKINSAVVVEGILDKSDFPQDGIRSDDEFQAIVDAQNEAEAEVRNAEVDQKTADAMHRLAKAEKESSKVEQ